MIRLLKGTVHSTEERAIILFTNGVGYQVFVPTSLLEEHDEELTLFIHTHIREDQMTLYGFRTKNELNFYELVLTINGVGPKMALAILNEPAQTIQNAIFTSNITALTKVSGVGKKIAERIILELKSKVIPTDLNQQVTSKQTENEEAIMALESLGYKRHHIQKVFSQFEEEIVETEEIIRVFLKRV